LTGDRRFDRYLVMPLAVVMAASLCVMMTLVFVDVFGRYLLDSPIRGSYEIMQCLMALLVFSGFPLVAASREHIVVGVFLDSGGKWVSAIRDVVINLASAGVTAYLAMRLFDQAVSLGKSGQVTGLSNIPLAPFTYFMCTMSALTVAVFVLHALQKINALCRSCR